MSLKEEIVVDGMEMSAERKKEFEKVFNSICGGKEVGINNLGTVLRLGGLSPTRVHLERYERLVGEKKDRFCLSDFLKVANLERLFEEKLFSSCGCHSMEKYVSVLCSKLFDSLDSAGKGVLDVRTIGSVLSDKEKLDIECLSLMEDFVPVCREYFLKKRNLRFGEDTSLLDEVLSKDEFIEMLTSNY